jgi:virulence-associated protein VapD
MYAVAFDLEVKAAKANHPSGNATKAYADIRKVLEGHGFLWRQGSLYTTGFLSLMSQR